MSWPWNGWKAAPAAGSAGGYETTGVCVASGSGGKPFSPQTAETGPHVHYQTTVIRTASLLSPPLGAEGWPGEHDWQPPPLSAATSFPCSAKAATSSGNSHFVLWDSVSVALKPWEKSPACVSVLWVQAGTREVLLPSRKSQSAWIRSSCCRTVPSQYMV